MKLAIASYHAPRAEGSAAGRQLWALGEALQELGHSVTALCWQPAEPADLPTWATWRPIPAGRALPVRARALGRPRSDPRRLAWDPPSDAVLLCDEPFGFAAADGRPMATGVHYSVALDVQAQGRWSPRAVQDLRAERFAVRRASHVITESERVRDAVGRGVVVPATVPLPPRVVDPVESPVVGLLADWSWAPNRAAAARLISAWPLVRAQVPTAQLLLGGRGACPVGTLDGVRWLGELPYAADLLSQAAVLAFPCPPTSGPKMKTLDALAHGVPVVTSAAGAEGVHPNDGLLVSDDLVQTLVQVLNDPAGRAERARAARSAMQDHHAPRQAAQARVDALGGATTP